MAFTNFLQLPVRIGLTGTEIVPILADGVDMRTTTGDIADLQFNLDRISTTPGAMLYRGPSAWVGLAPGTLGQFLRMGASDTPQWVTDLAADISVGSTIVTSGTNLGILYDNAGVLGQYTLTGTGTVVAMQTSPTFVTPTLGVATATSLLFGATSSFPALLRSGTTLQCRLADDSAYAPFASSVHTITQGTITANAPQIAGSVTWNNAAVDFTAWRLDITDTASGGNFANPSSYAISIFKGANQIFGVDKFGSIRMRTDNGNTFATALAAYDHGGGAFALRMGIGFYTGNGFNSAQILGQYYYGWTSSTIDPTSNPADTRLYRDAAYTIAQRNDANAQTFRVYNTYANSGTDYERGVFDWTTNSNWLTVGTAAGGTGTSRGIVLNPATSIVAFMGTTSSFPALKRSGATLQVRLADDSDYASFVCNSLFTAGRVGVGNGGPTISSGSGSPEGVVTADVGSLYMNTAGGTDTTLYTKNSGSGNTGWVAVDNV